jgi:hypothetical protein
VLATALELERGATTRSLTIEVTRTL